MYLVIGGDLHIGVGNLTWGHILQLFKRTVDPPFGGSSAQRLSFTRGVMENARLLGDACVRAGKVRDRG